MVVFLSIVIALQALYIWWQWGRKEIARYNLKLLLGMSKKYISDVMYQEFLIEIKRLGP